MSKKTARHRAEPKRYPLKFQIRHYRHALWRRFPKLKRFL